MKKNLGMLALIMAFWFTISFITNKRKHIYKMKRKPNQV